MKPPVSVDTPSHPARREHLVERHVARLQAIGIDEHLQLPVALAPDRDVRHARHRHQPRPHRPARQRRHLDLRQRLRREPIFSTRLSDDSGDSSTGACAVAGSDRGDTRQALLHELPRLASDRRPRRGSARPRRGRAPTSIESSSTPGTPASALSIGTLTNDSTSAVDRPGASVWISTSGGANSGKDVEGNVRRADRASATPSIADQQRRRRREPQRVETSQRIMRYLPTPNSVPKSSAAPRVTTVMPGSRPRAEQRRGRRRSSHFDAPAREHLRRRVARRPTRRRSCRTAAPRPGRRAPLRVPWPARRTLTRSPGCSAEARRQLEGQVDRRRCRRRGGRGRDTSRRHAGRPGSDRPSRSIGRALIEDRCSRESPA